MKMPTGRTTSTTTTRVAGGFTIIEVLIVLAIAGVIILLVFGAIPALERNSRNNQRKNDVSTILQYISRYQLNNSAQTPLLPDIATNLRLSYYSATDIPVQIILVYGDHTDLTANTDPNTVKIYDYRHCNPDGSGSTITQGSDYTDIVAVYGIETGGGSSGQCLEQ